MQTIKLLYTDDGRLLFSKTFPDVPEIYASANQDMIAMARFEMKMKEALYYAIPVLNPDKAFEKIAFNEPLERDKIYEIKCEYETYYDEHDGYKIKVL